MRLMSCELPIGVEVRTVGWFINCLVVRVLKNEPTCCGFHLYCGFNFSLVYGCSARIRVIASPVFFGFETIPVYGVGLSALCATLSNSGGPVVCFFVRFFSANVPAMGGRTSSATTASITWWIVETRGPTTMILFS